MHSQSKAMNHHVSLIFYLSISSLLLLSPPSQATAPPTTIPTTEEHQTLARIPPSADAASQPFLTSPSGNYAAYLLRRQAGDGSCYVQVQDTGAGQGVWESECAAVSSADACELVLSNAGLELYGGTQQPLWGVGAGGNGTEVLELADEGELRITDENGEVVWKSTDDPTANQGCGFPESPGVPPTALPFIAPPAPVDSAAAPPPFAGPVGGGGSLPFGQPAVGGQQPLPPPQPNVKPFGLRGQPPVGFEQQPGQGSNGVKQPFGRSGLPLVDNTPFDSGCCSKGVEWWFGMGLFVISLFFGFLF